MQWPTQAREPLVHALWKSCEALFSFMKSHTFPKTTEYFSYGYFQCFSCILLKFHFTYWLTHLCCSSIWNRVHMRYDLVVPLFITWVWWVTFSFNYVFSDYFCQVPRSVSEIFLCLSLENSRKDLAVITSAVKLVGKTAFLPVWIIKTIIRGWVTPKFRRFSEVQESS